MTRRGKLVSMTAAALLVAGNLAAAADARGGRLGIHPNFAGHAGGMHAGGMRPGAGGSGTMHTPGAASRPGGAGSGTRAPPAGGSGQHMVGWDEASRGPPRPGPPPGPGPGPGPRPPGPGPGPHPGPHPYPPPPPPPPPPAWGWGPYWGWDDDWAWGVAAGVATGAVIGAAAASAAPPPVAVGTVVQVLPSDCTATIIGNVTYEQCGASWFKPQYVGTTIQYLVVSPPR